MKLLLDQGVPLAAADLLTVRGFDTEHVSRLAMSTAKDAEILKYASDHDLIIVTLDADFHALLALSANSAPSVIRVRQQGLDAEAFTDVMTTILPRITEPIRRGVAVTVTATQIRIRHLPIKPPDRR